jgi:Cd2+/Zn2+-exporting ATPase
MERTVVRVEGMDCASCAATVEKNVGRLPGVHSATVNFAAGRLDAEHDPALALEKIEGAVRAAGYGVAKTEVAERSLSGVPRGPYPSSRAHSCSPSGWR